MPHSDIYPQPTTCYLNQQTGPHQWSSLALFSDSASKPSPVIYAFDAAEFETPRLRRAARGTTSLSYDAPPPQDKLYADISERIFSISHPVYG